MIQSLPPRVPWLRREQWDLFRANYANPGELHGSYDEWRTETEKSIRGFEAAGLPVQRVHVDVPAWLAWCRDERLRADARALLLFLMASAEVS